MHRGWSSQLVVVAVMSAVTTGRLPAQQPPPPLDVEFQVGADTIRGRFFPAARSTPRCPDDHWLWGCSNGRRRAGRGDSGQTKRLFGATRGAIATGPVASIRPVGVAVAIRVEVAVAGYDTGVLMATDVVRRKNSWRFDGGQGKSPTAIAVSADQKRLLVGYEDGAVRLSLRPFEIVTLRLMPHSTTG